MVGANARTRMNLRLTSEPNAGDNSKAEDLAYTDKDGNTILMNMAKHHNWSEDTIKPFIEKASTSVKPDILDAKNKNGETALHIAISNGRHKTARVLIKYSSHDALFRYVDSRDREHGADGDGRQPRLARTRPGPCSMSARGAATEENRRAIMEQRRRCRTSTRRTRMGPRRCASWAPTTAARPRVSFSGTAPTARQRTMTGKTAADNARDKKDERFANVIDFLRWDRPFKLRPARKGPRRTSSTLARLLQC